MIIELIDPNEITVATINVSKYGEGVSKQDALNAIRETFCKLYKEWDGSPGIIKDLGEAVFTSHGILLNEIYIDEEIYACK